MCETCLISKCLRLPFKASNRKSTKPLQLIHTDLSGIVRISNSGQYRYFLIFIDDYSRFCTVFLLSRKFQVFEAFKEYKSWIELKTGHKIVTLRSDNGTEYVNDIFNDYLKQNGIEHQLTNIYTPQQNGVAERMNRTIEEMARSMLKDAKLRLNHWPYAVMAAVYVRNRVLCSSIKYHVPFELFYNRRVNFNVLKQFGSKVIVRQPNVSKTFDDRGQHGVFLGYPLNKKGYYVYLPDQQSIITSRDVYFLDNHSTSIDCGDGREIENHNATNFVNKLYRCEDETVSDCILDNDVYQTFAREREDSIVLDDLTYAEEDAENQYEQFDVQNSTIENQSLMDGQLSTETNILVDQIDNPPEYPVGKMMLNRTEKLKFQNMYPEAEIKFLHPVRSANRHNKKCMYLINHITPKSYNQAIRSKEYIHWKQAMDDEWASILSNGTFYLVERKPKMKVIPVIWLYSIKYDRFGLIER